MISINTARLYLRSFDPFCLALPAWCLAARRHDILEGAISAFLLKPGACLACKRRIYHGRQVEQQQEGRRRGRRRRRPSPHVSDDAWNTEASIVLLKCFRLLHRSFFSLTVRPHPFALVQRRSPSSAHLFFCFRSPALVNTFSRPENIYYDLDGMLRIKQDPLYIEFEIVEAKGLLAADTEKSPPTSDPLVEAYVVFKKSMKKVTSLRPKKVRTKTIKESLSPNWRTKAKGDGSNKFSIDAKGMPSDALALTLKS